jgi:hypothetical protein
MQAQPKTTPALMALAALLSAGLALGAPATALAAGKAQIEIRTAAEHSEFASQSADVSQVHMHLHHVINCLEGSGGKDFDAAAGDPCKGQGNGALNDLGNAAKQRAMLEKALDLAKQGTKTASYEEARKAASTVHEVLRQAEATSG